MSDSKVVSVVGHQPIPAAQSYSFEQVQRMAVAFAKSGLFGVKDPDQALSLMLYAQGTGRHPAVIARDYHIINNKIAKTAEAVLRDFQSSGGRVKWLKYADDGVTGVFTHPLSPEPVTVDWDMARAKQAGLADKNGGMYSKFARQMFRSRCISEGVRTCAPDAVEGMYTPEEVRDMEPEHVTLTENQAVAAAVEQVQNETPKDRVDELIDAMDVTTLEALAVAFEAAWKETKGDANARKRVKSSYDAMKAGIESGDVK
jgi:hypothetical protein